MRLVVPFVLDGSPRQVRMAFAQALREAIQRAYADGRITQELAEELWRVVPEPERA